LIPHLPALLERDAGGGLVPEDPAGQSGY